MSTVTSPSAVVWRLVGTRIPTYNLQHSSVVARFVHAVLRCREPLAFVCVVGLITCARLLSVKLSCDQVSAVLATVTASTFTVDAL